MAKSVRIKLPVRKPEGTLHLAKRVSDKHTALGGTSPLNGFIDMADFESRRLSAATLQAAGDDADNLAQSKYNQADNICGIAEGQNKQAEHTVYWLVLQARDVLLLKFRGIEESLEEYGFNVVISQKRGRKYLRIDIPKDNPARLLELAGDIIKQHITLGAGSPLTGNVDMTLFEATVTSANVLLGEWSVARGMAQSKHNQALNIIGYGKGQNAQTEGTLYYDLLTARDRLLQFTSGAEQQMEEWGFDVVIS